MMGTELIRRHVKEESIEMPSIPPGFEPITTFSLKRVDDGEVASSCSVSVSASESHTAKNEPGLDHCDDEEDIKRSVKRRPWLNHRRTDSSSGNDSDSEQGVLEAIRISCAGYPTRRSFSDFVKRFTILAPEVMTKNHDPKEACKKILDKVGLQGSQIGKTKVFLRAGQMAELDARNAQKLSGAAKAVSKLCAKYLHKQVLKHEAYAAGDIGTAA